jgi:hypothetical protein
MDHLTLDELYWGSPAHSPVRELIERYDEMYELAWQAAHGDIFDELLRDRLGSLL